MKRLAIILSILLTLSNVCGVNLFVSWSSEYNSLYTYKPINCPWCRWAQTDLPPFRTTWPLSPPMPVRSDPLHKRRPPRQHQTWLGAFPLSAHLPYPNVDRLRDEACFLLRFVAVGIECFHKYIYTLPREYIICQIYLIIVNILTICLLGSKFW